MGVRKGVFMNNTTLKINLIGTNGIKEQEYNLPRFVLDASAYSEAVEYNYYIKHHEKLTNNLAKKEMTINDLIKSNSKSESDKIKLEVAKADRDAIKRQIAQLESTYKKFIGDDYTSEQRQAFYANMPARNMVLTFVKAKISITKLSTLYDAIVSYYNTYEGIEAWSPERKKDFTYIKGIMTEILGDRFNISKDSNPMYKSNTVKLSSAFVEGCINFIYGDYARNQDSNLSAKRKNKESLFSAMIKRYFSEVEYKNKDTSVPKTAKEVEVDTF